MIEWNCAALTDTLLEHGFTMSNLDAISTTILVLLFGHDKSFTGPLASFQKNLKIWGSEVLTTRFTKIFF